MDRLDLHAPTRETRQVYVWMYYVNMSANLRVQ